SHSDGQLLIWVFVSIQCYSYHAHILPLIVRPLSDIGSGIFCCPLLLDLGWTGFGRGLFDCPAYFRLLVVVQTIIDSFGRGWSQPESCPSIHISTASLLFVDTLHFLFHLFLSIPPYQLNPGYLLPTRLPLKFPFLSPIVADPITNILQHTM